MAIVVPIISSFDNRGIQKAIADFKNLNGAGQRSAFALMNTNKAVNTAAKNFAKLGAVGVGLAGVIGGSLVKAAYESQRVMKQTDAIIKATGGAAGLTTTQVAKLSTQLSLQTGVDDELIQSSMNLLLTFKKVQNQAGEGNDIFSKASSLMLDLGNVFGGTDKAAIQLGKALSNPISGITALRKSGIDFTDQQRAQIKTLVESGKTLEAQKLILAEIESQVGGTAKATATGFDRMKVAIGNVQENLGNLLIPAVERFANAIINDVLPVLDQFGEIVGEQGIGAGINFLIGSVLNAISNLGVFGKVVIGVTAGIVALNVATGVYKGTMATLNVITTLTNGSMKALIATIGAAKLALATAGAITAVLVAAGLVYGSYAKQKAEATKTTKDLTNALLAEKSAQSGLLVELYQSSKTARAFIDTQNALGLSTDDLAQFVQKGTGAASKYADAFKQADAQANGIQPTLIKYREILGLSSDTSLEYVARIRNMVEQLEKMRSKQTELNGVQALANKLTGTSATTTETTTTATSGLSKVVETAAQKFEKFTTALFGAANSNKSFTAAVKASKKAQSDLAEATQNVVTAQTKLNQIAAGYGANSTQASDARKELTQAERDAERAGYALETANFAVTDAELALQEAYANGDPTAIRQAQIDLAEAKLSVKDAQDALTTSTNNVAAAQKTLNEIVNGATTESQTYKDALVELQKAQKDELDAIDSLSDAKLRELEATKALAKANLLLKQTKGKLSSKQMKAAMKAINELTVAVNVPQASSVSSASSGSSGGFDFSGIDLSGISIGGLATLASGGIVTKPTLALIGEGGESEAVIPLSKMGGMGGDVYNITINSKIADQTLPDVLVAELRKFNRRSGAIDIQVA
jgi:hypothetical protein